MSLLEREGELSAVTPFQLPEGASQLAVVVGTANLPVVSAVLPTTGANERCRKRTAWNRNTDAAGHLLAAPDVAAPAPSLTEKWRESPRERVPAA